MENIVFVGAGFGSISILLLGYWVYRRNRESVQKRRAPFNILAANAGRSKRMALEMMQSRFEVQLTPDKEIRIDNLSGLHTRLIKLHLGLRISNPCEYPVSVEKVSWELWVGPVIKTFSSEPSIQLKAFKTVEDYVVQDLIREPDFVELAAVSRGQSLTGYVEGLVFCHTDFGDFTKKFFKFDVPFQLTGNLGSIIKEANIEEPDKRDALTGAHPRKFIEENFQVIADSASGGRPVSAMMVDIDYFKKFNDSFGHLIGDEILRMVGTKIREVLGEKGLAVRYGGDEFCIILEGVDSFEAETIARRLHKEVGECLLKSPQGELKITLSIGVAVLRNPAQYQELIKMADKALYKVKQAGRDNVYVDHEGMSLIKPDEVE